MVESHANGFTVTGEFRLRQGEVCIGDTTTNEVRRELDHELRNWQEGDQVRVIVERIEE
jgi:hypothetical protein